MKKLAQDFNTTAQDSNPGSHSRESEALPLSNCALNILAGPSTSRVNNLEHDDHTCTFNIYNVTTCSE